MARKLEFEIAGKSNVDPAVNQAKNSINKLKQDVAKAFDFKGAFSNAILGAVGITALLDRAIGAVTNGMRELAKIADEQVKSGIGAEEYQRLAFAAEDAGVSMSTLTKGIREMKKFMREARDDAEKMKIMTEGLGFSTEQVASGNISATEAFQRISKVLKQYEGDMDKATVMTAFFNEKISNEMIPILEALNDPKILDGLNVATKEQLKLIDESDRAWSKLWKNVKTEGALALASVTSSYMKYLGALEYYAQTGSLQGFAPMESQRKDFEKWYARQLNPPVAETKTVSTEQAKAQLDVFKKSQDTSGTKKSTISGSFNPENGPTGGVIGVGNNAQTLAMQEQVDLLKQIRDALNRGSSVVTTDFTKPDFIPHKQIQFK